jgi:CheY-like chemotaxis protein
MARMKLKIMIVEDDEHDFELLTRVLNKCDIDFEKVWLKNGEEAINCLDNLESSHSNSYSKVVFFVDINLPMFDGHQIVKRIKNNPYTKNDYVIVLSGSSQQNDIDTAIRNGADLYLEKPFGRQKIIEFSSLIFSKLTSLT